MAAPALPSPAASKYSSFTPTSLLASSNPFDTPPFELSRPPSPSLARREELTSQVSRAFRESESRAIGEKKSWGEGWRTFLGFGGEKRKAQATHQDRRGSTTTNEGEMEMRSGIRAAMPVNYLGGSALGEGNGASRRLGRRSKFPLGAALPLSREKAQLVCTFCMIGLVGMNDSATGANVSSPISPKEHSFVMPTSLPSSKLVAN